MKWSLIKALSQTYTLDILEALNKKPSRFTDLSDFSPNEKTRAQRLKELEDMKLISATSLKLGKRFFVHYELTDRGRAVLQKAKEISTL